MDPENADAQARSWVARRHSAALTSAELASLKRWLTADPVNRAALERAEAHWRLLGTFREDLAAPLAEARRARQSRSKRFAAMGVIAAVGISLAVVLYQGILGESRQWKTAAGARRDVVLPDGSRLSLNTTTVLVVRQSWFARTLYLQEGEIYIDVAADRRPFTVQTPHFTARDIGTRFTVRDTANRLEVAVIEGLVDVRTQRGSIRVSAGQRVLGTSSESVLRAVPARADGDAWRDGWIVFSETPLSEIVTELSRYSGIQLDLSDSTLGSRRVSGRFRVGDLDSALSSISRALDLTVERVDPRRIALSRGHR